MANYEIYGNLEGRIYDLWFEYAIKVEEPSIDEFAEWLLHNTEIAGEEIATEQTG